MYKHILLPEYQPPSEGEVLARAKDQPWKAIVEAAKRHGCDAVFMGSHGRKGLARLIHGSQAIDVFTHSDIPTLVVR
jgi:nucleotide-binding universal stress UspA family protein